MLPRRVPSLRTDILPCKRRAISSLKNCDYKSILSACRSGKTGGRVARSREGKKGSEAPRKG